MDGLHPRQLVFFLAFIILFCYPSSSSASGPVFYESFDETWEGHWIPSTKEEYSGIWKHAKSEGHEDFGLLVSEKARKYGVAVELPAGGVEVFDKPVVLQYDVRLQNGLECGGAYLKFLSLTEATDKLDNESPYTIMFGPDKCGSTNKVHFIFRHKNPKTKQYIEHHLKYPPTPINDKFSHVYTAVLYPNNTLFILIDGEVKKTADLLSSNDFEPPLIPAKLIPDPDDKKPEDWNEQEKIPDPDAKKPDDWDEDAPMEIEDLESEKPQDWLDDEPEEIDDPDAVKPEDWDDEEDGEWEAPKVSNPKCSDAPGCGKWERPKKMNPAYKGKWYPSMIENPHYQGIWKPREIANPDYFELDKPNLEAIGAIGIEIWTMQDGILFDNILVATDDAVALEYREKTWKVKYEAEKAAQPQPESSETKLSGLQGQVFEFLRYVAGLSVLSGQKEKLNAWIAKGEEKPTLTIGLLAAFSAVVLLVLYKLLFGTKKATPIVVQEEVAVERAKKEDISTPDDVNAEASKESMEENMEEVVEGEEEGSTLRKRQNQQE